MNNFPNRGDIYWVNFDPTVGTEIKKTRPALVVSNNAANKASNRIIVAPITSSAKDVYPFEVRILCNGINGKILLDQIRAMDKVRLGKKLTTVELPIMHQVDVALKKALGLS